MRVTQLKLENYRCHPELQVEFSARFTAVAGINGGGKTTLLRALRDVLSPFTQGLNGEFITLQPLQESDTAHIKSLWHGNQVRFEPVYPVKLSVEMAWSGENFRWEMVKNESELYASVTGYELRQKILSLASNADRPQQTLPLIAFYPADRSWKSTRINELSAATRRVSRLDGYRQWWEASISVHELLEWVIAKSFERYQHSSEQQIPFPQIGDDELALANHALGEAIEEFKSIRYDNFRKSVIIEWHGSKSGGTLITPFENLSDGQRTAIALLLDIVRRISLLNPHLGQQAVKETPGVVLIDELDIHLHPRWQRLLTRGLKAAFPRLQFVVASHSPQVIGELEPSEILLLQPGGPAHPQHSYGMDSSNVLEEIMGADERTRQVKEQLRLVFDALEANDLTQARRHISELRQMAPGIAELPGAEALLKRKEVLGK